jgi:Fe-S-cluster containining protein
MKRLEELLGGEEEIGCLRCGYCCKALDTRCGKEGLERISKFVGLPKERFAIERKYKDSNTSYWTFNPGGRCFFYDEEFHSCDIYPVRPRACERFYCEMMRNYWQLKDLEIVRKENLLPLTPFQAANTIYLTSKNLGRARVRLKEIRRIERALKRADERIKHSYPRQLFLRERIRGTLKELDYWKANPPSLEHLWFLRNRFRGLDGAKELIQEIKDIFKKRKLLRISKLDEPLNEEVERLLSG